MRAARDELGLGKDAVGYNFRHTFATELLQAGCPINELMKLMGHRNIETTLKYTKTVTGEGAKWMNRVFGGK